MKRGQDQEKAERPRLEARAIQRGLLAGLLAWLLPGAGHWFVGARRRAAAFFVIVGVAWGAGLAFDGNLAVVDESRAPWLTRLQVLANLAVGPVEPIARTLLYGELVYQAPPPHSGSLPPSLERRRERSFERWSVYGSAYLLAAGLMNMLVILDAWDLAIGRKR
jgi:hypothetical protein